MNSPIVPAASSRLARAARLACACACLVSFGTAFAQADEGDEDAAAGAPAASERAAAPAVPAPAYDELATLRANVERQLPGLPLTSVAETPVDGLYELVIDGQIYYADRGGEYLIDGSLIRLATRENLTDARLGTLHMALLAGIDRKDMLVYEPKEPTGRSITVFTDISCGYCRRLHEHLGELLDAGIEVRYLLFPRTGIGSQGAKDLESVWCADDPQAAMTNAKAGGRIEPATCDNPIEQHVALAERVGLRGTPLIYVDSGERIPGYREPADIIEMVASSKPWIN